MHELSVASSIANSVMDFARKQKAKKVIAVTLAVGELTSLAPEQLKFCYKIICEETLIEGSTLEIEEIKAIVSCPYCSYEGAPKMWEGTFHFTQVPILECPKCGKGAKPIRGKECTVKNVKYIS